MQIKNLWFSLIFFAKLFFAKFHKRKKYFPETSHRFCIFSFNSFFRKTLNFAKKVRKMRTKILALFPFFAKVFVRWKPFIELNTSFFDIKVLTTVLHVLHVNFPWNSKSSRKLYNDFLNKKYLRGRMQLNGGV